jgi:alkylhydroperoxidase family enzyme
MSSKTVISFATYRRRAPIYDPEMALDDWLAGTDALAALDAAHDAAWSAVDADLLALCRQRMAMLRRHEPTLASMSAAELATLRRWPTSPAFGDLERAALEFTEQYLLDVAALDDAQVEGLGVHLGDQGLVDFVNALLVVEQRMALELFLDGALR